MMVASHCKICNSMLVAVTDALWQSMHDMHMKRHVIDAAKKILENAK